MIMHTKGPWGSKRLATYNDPGHVILWPDKGGSHMRRLDSAGSFTAADAALISAAPELLSACKALLDVLSASYGTQKPVPLNCPEASKAHAAINKAEEVLSAW